jgi:hypothetical protein
MKNKRGQYYLIAAIIIASIIVGIVSIKNYATAHSKPDLIIDLGSELKEECPRIIEDSIKNSRNPVDELNKFLGGEYAEYFLKKTEKTNVIFVYGYKASLNVLKYNVSMPLQPSISGITLVKFGDYSQKGIINSNPENVTIKLADGNINKEFQFNTKEENIFYFYYMIFQEKNGELYIERN